MNERQKIYILILSSILLLSFVNAASFPVAFSSPSSIETNQYPIVTGVNPDPNEKEDIWSEKQICKFTNGCLEDDSCYPLGYIRNNQSCVIYETKWGFKRREFINMSDSGQNCSYDYECHSNFCFNRKCVSSMESLIYNLSKKIDNLELKLNIELEQKNKEIDIDNITEKTQENVSDEKLDIGFFNNFFDWNRFCINKK